MPHHCNTIIVKTLNNFSFLIRKMFLILMILFGVFFYASKWYHKLFACFKKSECLEDETK